MRELRKLATVTSALTLLGVLGIAGSSGRVLAQGSDPNEVVNYETIFASLNPDGSLKNVQLVNDLRVFGDGDIVVTDPSSTQDLRTLSGWGAPDRVGQDEVRWSLENVEGSRQIVTSSTPEMPPPVSMVASYTLDNQQIEPKDLVGESGRVGMIFDVSNTTAQPMELTFEDADGKEQVFTADVVIPMVGRLQMDLPPGTFSQIEAPGAEIVNRPDGSLTLQWNLVMAPPIGSATQTFKLMMQAEDFALGPIRLEAVPVVPRDQEFLRYSEDKLVEDEDSASSLYVGASSIGDTLGDLHDGTLKLLDGMQQLFDGAQELTAGLGEAFAGSGQLTAGLGTATSGSGQLTSGLRDAHSGSGQITGGLSTAHDGSTELTGGLKSLRGGLKQIGGGLDQLGAGLPAAQVGAQTIAGGAALLQAGAQAIQACLTGGGTPCNGNPSINTIAGQIGTGAGDIGTGAGQIGTGAGNIITGAQGIQNLAGLCSDAAICPDIATIAGQIETGAGAIQAGAGGIQAGAGSIQAGAGGIQAIAANLAASIGSTGAEGTILFGLESIRLGALQLADGVAEAIGGVGQLAAGVGSALDGTTQLFDGSRQLTDGLGQLSAGSGELTAGLGRAATGSAELTAGLVKATDGSGALTAGLSEAASGSGRLADGIGQAKDGVGQVESGVYLMNELGVQEIARSANQAAAELGRAVSIMKAQDERAVSESISYGPPSSDQAETVAGGSGVVLTLDALDGRGAASTARGVGVGIGFLALLGLGLIGARGLGRQPG
jgi:putative membrane protein